MLALVQTSYTHPGSCPHDTAGSSSRVPFGLFCSRLLTSVTASAGTPWPRDPAARGLPSSPSPRESEFISTLRSRQIPRDSVSNQPGGQVTGRCMAGEMVVLRELALVGSAADCPLPSFCLRLSPVLTRGTPSGHSEELALYLCLSCSSPPSSPHSLSESGYVSPGNPDGQRRI